jgi:hypothetical protein
VYSVRSLQQNRCGDGTAYQEALGLKRGQPFNAEYPDYFLARLVEDQVMDNLGRTKRSIAPDPENKIVDVTLTLEGEKRKPEKKETEFP